MSSKLISEIESSKLVVIARGVEAEKLIPVTEAVYEGGIRFLEITYSANIIASPAQKVIVGGKMQLKKPVAMMVEMNSDKRVETVPEEVADFATAYGCVRIYEESLKH